MSSRFAFPLISIGAGFSPADGAKLGFFEANTSQPKDTFKDEGLVTANTNPVIADGLGVFSDIWMPDRARYAVTLSDKNDVQIVTLDPVVTPKVAGTITQVFDTVTEMVADLTLVAGDVVRFRGYFLVEDGGGNEGEIVPGGTGTVDGGMFINLVGAAPLQFKGSFPGGFICVEQYGVIGDDESAPVVAANTAALTLANLTLAFKRVRYLGKTYSVGNSIPFRSGYRYEGVRNSTEIKCLVNKNVIVSEAFLSNLAVGPTGEMSLINISARGLQTNTDQIGVVMFDFNLDLQFVEAKTCGGGGIECAEADDDGVEPASIGNLINNRLTDCKISTCAGVGIKMGGTSSTLVGDFTIRNCVISMAPGSTSHLVAQKSVGSTMENILFEGSSTPLVADIRDAVSTKLLGFKISSVIERGVVLSAVQGGVILTGLDIRANNAVGGLQRLIDIDQSSLPNVTPSVLIEANVILSADVSGITVVHNQGLLANINATILTNGVFADQLILRGGTDAQRLERIRIQVDTTTEGVITDRGNKSDQLGLSHSGRRLGYTEIAPGVQGGASVTVPFTIRLTSFQELIPRIKIIASLNNGSPVTVRFRQDLFITSRDNALDEPWFLGKCDPPEVQEGFLIVPAITLIDDPINNTATLEVTFQFANALDFGIVQLSF